MDSFGISAKIIGPRQSLQHAQAERGFAFVSEKTCEDFLLHEGNEVPEGDDKDENDRKTELAMACIAARKPAWTSEEASAVLAKAFLAEHPDIYEHIHVPADCLTDVVDKGEVQKVMEWEQEKQKEQKKSSSCFRLATERCTSISRLPSHGNAAASQSTKRLIGCRSKTRLHRLR